MVSFFDQILLQKMSTIILIFNERYFNFSFFYFRPSKYVLSMFHDIDSEGIWNFFKRKIKRYYISIYESYVCTYIGLHTIYFNFFHWRLEKQSWLWYECIYLCTYMLCTDMGNYTIICMYSWLAPNISHIRKFIYKDVRTFWMNL